jgi:hypothetical protein
MAAFLLQKGSLVNPPKLDFSDSLNRTVYASPPLAARGSVSLGRFAPTLNSTHILSGLQTYGLPIRPAKTSYTAGTLCAIGADVAGRISI